jgi:GT2 family glycosyltransferase
MQWYDRCFNSLQKSDVPVQIIVIDNASSDGTVEYIKTNYQEIILIESKENLGFAKANNIGLRYALDHGANYVFLLNQDAWLVQNNCIEELIKQSQLHPEFGILSPLQLYGSGNRIAQDTQAHYLYKSNNPNDFVSDLYFGRLKDIYETNYVSAASWLLPIEIVKSIGGFDPLFYHYGEDDNYIQRLHYFGWKIGICPKINICHDYENRSPSYTSKNLDWKKYMLINFGNINANVDIDSTLKNKRKILFVQALRLNRKLLKKSFPEYCYLRNIKKAIEYSRSTNKIKCANWL